MEDKKPLIEFTEDRENRMYIIKLSTDIGTTKEGAIFFLNKALKESPWGDLKRAAFEKATEDYVTEIKELKARIEFLNSIIEIHDETAKKFYQVTEIYKEMLKQHER